MAACAPVSLVVSEELGWGSSDLDRRRIEGKERNGWEPLEMGGISWCCPSIPYEHA